MVFLHTDTHTPLGTTFDGKKVYSTTVLVTDTGTGATQITISPLERVIEFVAAVKSASTSASTVYAAGTNSNQVSINPSASINASIIEIISWGK
jgi:hypothetical protein